jgi:hypothetical protein
VLIGLLALTLAGAGIGWWEQDLLKERINGAG